MSLDGLDLTALTESPTRLRAMAAAVSLVIAGEQPSVSRVAELAGVSRQALHKSHEPVCAYIARVREGWQPPSESPTGKLLAELTAVRQELASEKKHRKEAEKQLERALHHLELSDATVHALRRPGTNVASLGRSGST